MQKVFAIPQYIKVQFWLQYIASNSVNHYGLQMAEVQLKCMGMFSHEQSFF